MANSIRDVVRHDHIWKSFDSFLIDALPDANLGSLGLGIHLGKVAFHNSHSKGQSCVKKMAIHVTDEQVEANPSVPNVGLLRKFVG